MDGYKGAEEIDKCVIRLAFVSAFFAFLVIIVPGPCIVTVEENRSEMVEC